MRVYLDEEGKYRQAWSHKVLIPTEDNLRWIAMLDAAADEKGNAFFADVEVVENKPGFTLSSGASRTINNSGRVVYTFPGKGTYEGERDC